jgi:hypothetical protein
MGKLSHPQRAFLLAALMRRRAAISWHWRMKCEAIKDEFRAELRDMRNEVARLRVIDEAIEVGARSWHLAR